MDWLKPAGFVFLNWFKYRSCKIYDRGFESHLRLALWVLLQESPDALNMAGPDCAPWGLPARSTTGRSVLNILGRQDLPFVNGGNCMVARLLGMNQNEIPQLKYVHGQHFNNSPYQVGGLLPSLSIPSSDLCGRESFCQFVTTAPTLELVSKCYLLGDLASNLEKKPNAYVLVMVCKGSCTVFLELL